jgi:hypothetical protein
MLHTFLYRLTETWRANVRMQSESRQRAGFDPIPTLDELWGASDLLDVNAVKHSTRNLSPICHAPSMALRYSPRKGALFRSRCRGRPMTMMQRALDADTDQIRAAANDVLTDDRFGAEARRRSASFGIRNGAQRAGRNCGCHI